LAGNIPEKFGKGIHIASGRRRVKYITQQANGFRPLISTQSNGVTERSRKIRTALTGEIRAPKMCVAYDSD